VSLFEVGPVFLGRKPNEQAEVAAMLRAGLTHAKSWIDTPRDWDAFDAKADALATLAAAGAPIANLQVYRTAPGYYHPSRSGALCLGKDVLAYFGEVHPAILGKMGLEGRAVATEVFLDKVPNKVLKTKTQKKLTLSPFQPVHRDFAFIADKELEAGKLVRAVKGVDKDLITTVNVFDVYEGKNLEGKKSIAIEVVIEPMEKTLTDAELDNLSQRIIKAATAEGATLRS
jgi:phenylalanyl-tRNA synthetase beta chain